jgi:phosphatidylinositol alpha-mannosyltransferase
MRVALVCPYSWTVPGGVQSHIAGLARSLRTRGHDVEVIAPADGPVSMPGFVPAGPSIPILDNGSWVRVALDPVSAARTARLVRGRGYDLVHVHEPMIPAVGLAALYAAQVPLVGTFHMYARRPRWYRPFSPLARRAVPRLDARIAVSQAALRHVARTCPGEYHVIPNGIDVAAFDLRAERDGSRILFIGRADPRKGLCVLLDAFSLLPDSLTLELVGVTRDKLRRLPARLAPSVAARILAHGRVGDEERARILARADVLCAPALEGESFGIVLVEGMAAGLPVVATAIPGYVDVLPPTCGRLVPPGDPAALGSALAELVSDPELRTALGEAGRQEALRYDWSRVAAEIVDVYDEAVERAAARSSRPSSGRVERAAMPGSVGSRKLKKR